MSIETVPPLSIGTPAIPAPSAQQVVTQAAKVAPPPLRPTPLPPHPASHGQQGVIVRTQIQDPEIRVGSPAARPPERVLLPYDVVMLPDGARVKPSEVEKVDARPAARASEAAMAENPADPPADPSAPGPMPEPATAEPRTTD